MKKVLALLLIASSLGAQGAKEDTVHVNIQRVWIDSLTRNVQPALARYCSGKAAVKYMKDACAIFDRQLPRLNATENAWLVAPTPPDTTPPTPVRDCGVAECPRASVLTPYPTPVRIVNLPVPSALRTVLNFVSFGLVSDGDLQAALNTAQPGDEIRLAAGGTYTGNFLWSRCLEGWVTITGPNGPPEGTRITSAGTVAFQYPKLVSTNAAPVLTSKLGGCKLRLSRVEITAAPQSANYNYGLVKIGDGEPTLDTQPNNIIVDRVYLHGSDTTFTQNAVIGNGQYVALIDSWIDHVRWKGVESHCFVAWSGAGPLKVANNYLNCAGIGVLIGGARRAVPGVGPSDIEVLANHITKDSSYIGYVAKNGLELKDARRVYAEGNVIERSFYGAQTGMLINLQSLTDEGDTTVQTADVTIRFNRLRYGSQCFMASGQGYNGVAKSMTRVQMDNNLCTETGTDSMSRVATISGKILTFVMRHNTFVRSPLLRNQGVIPDTGPSKGIVFQDNIYGFGQSYGCVFRSGGATGMAAWLAFDSTAVVKNNVCWANAGAKTPTTDFFPATQADVGFAADWSLLPTSPYRGKASDGKDPGADVPELLKKTAGVTS